MGKDIDAKISAFVHDREMLNGNAKWGGISASANEEETSNIKGELIYGGDGKKTR